MSTLMELSQDMELLDAMLDSSGGEITPEIEQALDTWASDLDSQFDNKIDGYAALITELAERAKVREEQGARMRAKAAAGENAARHLRNRLKMVFESRGIKKVETQRFTVSVVSNGGKLAMTLDEAALPNTYLMQPPPVPDTARIRQELESGVMLEFARLEPRGTRLSIR